MDAPLCKVWRIRITLFPEPCEFSFIGKGKHCLEEGRSRSWIHRIPSNGLRHRRKRNTSHKRKIPLGIPHQAYYLGAGNTPSDSRNGHENARDKAWDYSNEYRYNHTKPYSVGIKRLFSSGKLPNKLHESIGCCLLYTSDAADEEDSVDLGGRRIIKKKKK